MSTATMLVAKVDGKFSAGFEYGNAWLGAAAIWTRLFDTYVPKRSQYDSWLGDSTGRLWKLSRDSRLSPEERVALVVTFDNCCIPAKDLAVVAAALDSFSTQIANSHLPAWANKMRELAADPKVRAVAFHHTSVTCNPWWDVTDEESGDGRPYSLKSRKRRHWFIFDEYPELKPKRARK